MPALAQDVRFGWRILRRSPLVTSVALVSLAVGMSATIVVFSLLNAVAFRSLPVADPAALRLVFEQRGAGLNHNFSYQDFTELRAHQRAFTDLTAYSAVRVTMARAEGSELVDGEIVTGSFFPMLGIPMRLGRGLTAEDDDPIRPLAIVVSESFWRRLGRGGAGLGGEPLILNTQAFTIVGVAASPFRGMQIGRDARFWAPLRSQRVLAPAGGVDLLARPGASWLTLLGRLRAGIADVEAASDLARVERALPVTPERSRERVFVVQPGHQGDSMLASSTASPLQLLLAAAALVLVVACANVAGLLLARAAGRERELVLRTALGASRARLTRLLLVEAALLGAGATLIALVVSRTASAAALPLMARFGEPVALDVTPDWRVLAFAAGAGVAATLTFALVPVLMTLRRTIAPVLAETSRGASASRSRAVVRRGLVATQFALSLGLVFVALLLVRTLYNLHTAPTGFAIDHLSVLAVDAEAAQLTPGRRAQYLIEAADRLRARPGVQAVAFAQIEPLDFGGSRTTIAIPGYTPAPDEDLEINYNRVTAGYFDTMGIAPIDGRVFDARDVAGAPGAVIVNETMARRFWPGGRAVGRQIRLGDAEAVIVGMVPDVKYRTLREAPGPSFYLAGAQSPPRFGSFHVRTAGPPAAMLDDLRRTLAAVDPAVPITRVRTLRDQAAINVNDDRLAMTIAAALAGAALLLAAVGLYGAMAYAVGQRTREIGIRLALGAIPNDVRRLVIGQGVTLALVGSALGVGLGLALARAIEHRLFGIAAADLSTIAAALALLAGVGWLATWLPARRAARVDPVEALRAE